MKFWKMNGAGNDFIILNNLEEGLPPEAFPGLARTLCERHMSLGADGLMAVDAPLQGGDFRMLFFNSDGSVGEMCGNGARCICRYGYENGLAGETQTIETTAGIVTGRRVDRRSYRIRLNDPSVIDLHRPAKAHGETWDCAYVELGNPGIPHAVVLCPGLSRADRTKLLGLGRALRHASAFPRGANVNFCDIDSPQGITELTYERGVEDFTYACGTGSGASVLALTLMGRVTGQDVAVSVPGGTLRVTIDREDEDVRNIWLTGPTNIVCKGEITDEELEMRNEE
ncbi:MAG: diaminopimelate epimerase [Oscillibacter sp.]|jgi:diaminopimelate epimerase|nr:diaminopimelate epimerase [Oscillibacter sp.]